MDVNGYDPQATDRCVAGQLAQLILSSLAAQLGMSLFLGA